MTDAGLLFPPSQIALTAILNSASRAGLSMETWVFHLLYLLLLRNLMIYSFLHFGKTAVIFSFFF